MSVLLSAEGHRFLPGVALPHIELSPFDPRDELTLTLLNFFLQFS